MRNFIFQSMLRSREIDAHPGLSGHVMQPVFVRDSVVTRGPYRAHQ